MELSFFSQKKKKVPPLCLLPFAFCLLLSTDARPQEVAFVRVAAESTAQADRFTLGDIAEVQTNDATVAERLRAVPLGYAPQVGVARELARERIALALTAAGFAAGAVRLEAPPVVVIRRAAQTVAPELVRAAVASVALRELRANGAVARLVRLDLPPVIAVPAGEIEARAVLGSVRNLFAPFIVAVELWQSGRIVHRFSATAQVEAYAPVLVAARDLAANVRLRKDDLELEVRRLERPMAFYLHELARVRGASLRRAVARGELLTTDLLQAEIVVKPGDTVRIVAETGRLQIAAPGEARAAGRVGDRIQVKNQQSGLLLQAVVVDEGLVSVRF